LRLLYFEAIWNGLNSIIVFNLNLIDKYVEF
jgi:hypothetical protein